MNPFRVLVDWLRQRGALPKRYDRKTTPPSGEKVAESIVCTHGEMKESFRVTVLGVECAFDWSEMCRDCLERYLNDFSTTCAACSKPILPGMSVGQAWVGAPHPYTHLASDCCASAVLYCGRWGEGRLITLHELEPERFLEGTSSVMDHIISTGRPIITNLD